MNVSVSTYIGSIMYLLFDTSNALNVTLTRLVSLIKKLLLDLGFRRLFRKLPEWQIRGRMWNLKTIIKWMLLCIKYATMLLCIKLYNKINIELSINYNQQVCCIISLLEKETFTLMETFSLKGLLSKIDVHCIIYLVTLLSRDKLLS